MTPAKRTKKAAKKTSKKADPDRFFLVSINYWGQVVIKGTPEAAEAWRVHKTRWESAVGRLVEIDNLHAAHYPGRIIDSEGNELSCNDEARTWNRV